jgi:hypothetical protein
LKKIVIMILIMVIPHFGKVLIQVSILIFAFQFLNLSQNFTRGYIPFVFCHYYFIIIISSSLSKFVHLISYKFNIFLLLAFLLLFFFLS